MSFFVDFSLIEYDELQPDCACDLFQLRKKTFHDRLDWKVECVDDMEKDRFDNENTTYLLGRHGGKMLCGARFIDAAQPTMISEIFHEYFEDIAIPTDTPCCEISRLFLDKDRRDSGNLRGRPVSKALFIAMITYCMKKNYRGMYAVASRGMYTIFRHAHWKVEVIQKGLSEKGENIYYIFMPANESAIEDIIKKDKDSDWLNEILQQIRNI